MIMYIVANISASCRLQYFYNTYRYSILNFLSSGSSVEDVLVIVN